MLWAAPTSPQTVHLMITHNDGRDRFGIFEVSNDNDSIMFPYVI